VGRLRERIRADRLGDPRCNTVEDARRGLGGDIPGAEPCSARGQDHVGCVREVLDRPRDRRAIVRNDAPDDGEALSLEKLGKEVAASILSRSLADPVRDRQHRRVHVLSFVFSTNRTSSTVISLSIALAM
jgi:hypothetical protein